MWYRWWPCHDALMRFAGRCWRYRLPPSLAACTDSGPDCGDGASCTVAELGETVDLRIGAAVRSAELQDDATYRRLVGEEFASLTPDAELKWKQVEPEPYDYRFEQADQIVELAEANEQEIRGHNLFWGQRIRTPDHVNALRDPESLTAAMRLHAETVLGRYRGRIPRYDVVNEPFVYDEVERADSIYQEVLGDDWIALAFELAHEVDPDAELWINMTGASREDGKHEAQLALVTDLLDAGVPLHGVGPRDPHRHRRLGRDPVRRIRRRLRGPRRRGRADRGGLPGVRRRGVRRGDRRRLRRDRGRLRPLRGVRRGHLLELARRVLQRRPDGSRGQTRAVRLRW